MAALRLTAREAARLTGQAAKTPVRGTRKPQRPVVAAPVACVQAITLELPLPPTGAGQPGSGVSRMWQHAARANAAYRTECLALLPRVNVPMFARAEIRLQFFHGPALGRYRARDVQRAIAAFCAGVDAIVDAGILRDDCASVLSWGACEIVSGIWARGRACVRVTLSKLDCD